jgi:hypothetical protein
MRADLVEYEQAYRWREVACLPSFVDLRDHFRQLDLLHVRDFLQIAPEGIFEAHARFVSINDDGAFDDQWFHGDLPKSFRRYPLPIRCDEIVKQVPFSKKHLGCGIETLFIRRENETRSGSGDAWPERSRNVHRGEGMTTSLMSAMVPRRWRSWAAVHHEQPPSTPTHRSTIIRWCATLSRFGAATPKPVCIGCKASFDDGTTQPGALSDRRGAETLTRVETNTQSPSR